MGMSTKIETGAPDAWLHDGEWARVGSFFIYPSDGFYHIGRPSGVRDYRDVDGGFENMQAAIDHAIWMKAEQFDGGRTTEALDALIARKTNAA